MTDRPLQADGLGAGSGLEALTPIQTATMHDQVYAEIRRQIMAGRFRPGQSFSMQDLAGVLGTSTTPVREALRRLAAERAVEIRPKRAVMIPRMSRARFEEIGEARLAVEGLATERAATRMTPAVLAEAGRLMRAAESARRSGDVRGYLAANQAFHFAIYRASRSQVLLPIIESLWIQIGPVQALYTLAGLSVGAGAHARVLSALRRREPAAARAAMVDDIATGVRHLLRHAVFDEV